MDSSYFSSPPVNPSDTSHELDLAPALSKLDRFIRQRLAERGTPGLAVALTNRQRTLAVATFGFADISSGQPVTPHTLFDIGAIGTSFTAIILLQLQDEGLINLLDPITEMVPWFSVPAAPEPIAIHHLLSHTSGLIRGADFACGSRYDVWHLRDTDVGFAAGEQFHYSNVGYAVLGYAIEAITGKTYADNVRERILLPLGMTMSEPVITHEARRRLAVGYQPSYDDRPSLSDHGLVPATWLEHTRGDGSIAMTAGDLATYTRMLLNGGQVNTGQEDATAILSEMGFDLLTRPAIICRMADPEHVREYAFGLEVWEDDGRPRFAHDGTMIGYASAMRGDTAEGIGVVVLINGPGDAGEIADYALELLQAAPTGLDATPLPPPLRPQVIADARSYVGTYAGLGGEFRLVEAGDGLSLERTVDRITLTHRGLGRLYADHPDYARFVLNAEFDAESGALLGLGHGGDWYAKENAVETAFQPTPTVLPAWYGYAGHYRSHNPSHSNMRVILRRGKLLLIWPCGDEIDLVPLSDGRFRVGVEPHLPERMWFDTSVNGPTLRAHYDGQTFYRVDTP